MTHSSLSSHHLRFEGSGHDDYRESGNHVLRQTLNNAGDSEYTLEFDIGGQKLQGIPDTGSFDLLVFSRRCMQCGSPRSMYDDSQSRTYSSNGFEAEQTFGSGRTQSVEAFDRVQIGDDVVDKQAFWEVVDADTSFGDSAFQAIFGVGPPSSALKIARQESQDVAKEVRDMAAHGEEVSQFGDVVEHYKAVVEHAAMQVPFLQAVGMRTYSICLRPESQSSGVWIWNDDAAEQYPSLFTHVRASSSMYWAAELTDVHFERNSFVGKESGLPLGCGPEDGKCSVVVDTGTSLLVVPSATYTKVVDMLDELRQKQQFVCENISFLPDIVFTMSGQTFRLPPESYMGQLDGEVPTELATLMPHARNSDMGQNCQPLLMTIDEVGDEGPVWILGLPFFRHYYTTFKLSEDSQEAGDMFFARSESSCNPGTFQAEALTRAPRVNRQLRIDATKLRLPAFVNNRVRRGNKLSRRAHRKAQ